VPKVHFVNEQITVEVPPRTTLREVALKHGIEIYRGMWTHFNCFGNGVCGRCRVWLLSPADTVSSPSLRERFHLVRGKQRLACQMRILGDVEVRTRPIGPAVIRETAVDYSEVHPSYREQAAQRYEEAKQEEARKAAEAAKKAAEKKAKEAKEAAEKQAKEAEEIKQKAAALTPKATPESKPDAAATAAPAAQESKPDDDKETAAKDKTKQESVGS
jgi:ferredoxin